MTWKKSEDFAEDTGPTKRFLHGMIRKLQVLRSDSPVWNLLGRQHGQGGREVFSVHNFSGIGFYARPPKSGNAQVIAVAVGSMKCMAIVATRDENTRQIGAGDLEEGETCVYNDKARIVVKADGTVEIRLHGGIAVPLALKSDVEAVDAKYAAHLHGASGSPTTGPLSAFVPGAPPVATPLAPAAIVGTTVLKGQ